MTKSMPQGTSTPAPQTPGRFAAALAGPVRQLASILALAAALLVLGAGAQWSGDAGIAAIAGGMAAGVLLGVLLRRRPAHWLVGLYVMAASAGLAGGVLVAGGMPLPAAIAAAGPVLGALIGFALLRARRIDPTGLAELAPFAWAAAAGIVPVSLAQMLAMLTGSGPNGEHTWFGAALGVLATLPLLLAWRNADAGPPATADAAESPPNALVPAVLAWLVVPIALWWRPDLLILALLPLLALAPRLGPRAIAGLALATAVVLAGFIALPAGQVGSAPDLVALPASVGLLAALALAILAAQRDRNATALASTQDHLRAVTERSPTLIATLDADGRHQFANRSYLQWLGKDAAQVLGQSLLEVYADGAGAIAAPVRRAAGGQPQREQIQWPDGRALDAQLEPRFSAAGPVDGVHLLAQDASWRSGHERNLDALLGAALDPIIVLDAGGVVVRLNHKIETLLGSPHAALLGKPLAAWLEPSAAAALAAALGRVCDDYEPQQLLRGLDLHARRADGGTFPVELQLAPMDGARGVQAVVAVQDLGPRLAWETLMVETRGQAEATLDAIGDAVVACDLGERITVFNPAAAKLTGWAEHEAVGQPLAEVLRFSDAASGAELPSLLGEAIRRNVAIRKHADKLLRRRDGHSAAVAESAAPVRDSFGQATGGVLLLHDVSQSHAQAQTLTHQAQHDHLTGLPNRVLLQDRLTQALTQMDRGYKGALLYLDLDHFKPINDRLGHPVGDRVLQEVASRLRAGVREDDTVSRQGGDEFVLLLVRLADPRDAARVAGKLIESIEQPIHVDGHELSVSASIGIALFPQDGADTDSVTRHADAALYHAKDAGRGRYSYFTDIMGASAEERMRTEHDLRIALSNGDFLLAWQPQVHLPKRRIAGVEALVRWRQLDGTVVLPEQFIPVAEETGLVVQIDEWVLHEACRQNCRWQQEWRAQGLAPVPVSVNVSLARFDAERLLGHVRAVLQDTGLEPRWLEIEFKGAQLFAHGPRGLALVAALKALGVRVAADDFGSGQASLGALAHFGFDTLKVDRAFVQNVADDRPSRAITEAVLGIGQAMGFRVIAKGVETDAQYDALVQMGCAGMQGLMFGEAGAAAQITRLAASGVVERVAVRS